MHMTYVCALIRSIISLHNLINNKIYNIEKALEEEEEDKKTKEEQKKKAEEKNAVAAAGKDESKKD